MQTNSSKQSNYFPIIFFSIYKPYILKVYFNNLKIILDDWEGEEADPQVRKKGCHATKDTNLQLLKRSPFESLAVLAFGLPVLSPS